MSTVHAGTKMCLLVHTACVAGTLGTPRRSGGLAAKQQSDHFFNAAADPEINAVDQSGDPQGQTEGGEAASVSAAANTESQPGTRQSKRQVQLSSSLTGKALCRYCEPRHRANLQQLTGQKENECVSHPFHMHITIWGQDHSPSWLGSVTRL